MLSEFFKKNDDRKAYLANNLVLDCIEFILDHEGIE